MDFLANSASPDLSTHQDWFPGTLVNVWKICELHSAWVFSVSCMFPPCLLHHAIFTAQRLQSAKHTSIISIFQRSKIKLELPGKFPCPYIFLCISQPPYAVKPQLFRKINIWSETSPSTESKYEIPLRMSEEGQREVASAVPTTRLVGTTELFSFSVLGFPICKVRLRRRSQREDQLQCPDKALIIHYKVEVLEI